MIKPQDLVYPVVFNRNMLLIYLTKNARKYDAAAIGFKCVEVIRTLESCEKILRSMYVPDYSGL